MLSAKLSSGRRADAKLPTQHPERQSKVQATIGDEEAGTTEPCAAQDPACGYRHEESRPGDGHSACQADWVAGQARLGRIRCPDPGGLAGRLGDTVWTAVLQWSSVSGSRVREQYGVTAGHEGSAADLTVRKARRNYICSGRSCNHLILAGTLHGAELYYEHYCPCCVVSQCPQARFTAEWPPLT